MKAGRIAYSNLSAITDEKGDLLFDRNKPHSKTNKASGDRAPSHKGASSGVRQVLFSLFKLSILVAAVVLLLGVFTGHPRIDVFLDQIFHSAKQLLSRQYAGSASDSISGQVSASSQRDLMQRQLENEAGVEVGNIAPDFKLFNLFGAEVNLSDYRGTVVVLEFWASWCPPCKASIPKLVGLQEKYYDKDFIVLAVSVDEGTGISEKLSQFCEEHKTNYPVLLHNEDVIKAYKIRNVPTTFIINKQGRIANKFVGLDEDSYASTIPNQIDNLLGE